MNSKFKVLKSIFILGLLLSPAWSDAVQAQDESPLYCAELATEDCDILAGSRAAMMELRSASSDVKVEFIMSDIPDAPFDELTLNVEQQSRYMLTDEGVAAREKMNDVELITELLQEDPTGFLELYLEIVQEGNSDSSFRIQVSDETMMLIQEAIEEESGEAVPFELPTEFAVASRLVDGTVYTNLSGMLDPMPGFKATGDIWFGFEYVPMMDIAMMGIQAEGDLEPMSEDEAPITAQFIAATTGANGAPLITTIANFPFSTDILPSFDVERIEDTGSAGDGETIRFRTTVDYATLLSEPIVQELLADLIRDPDFGDMEMSNEEMAEVLSLVQMMGPTVLDSLGLEVIEEIDSETGFVLESQFNLNVDIETLEPLITMAGGPDLSGLEAAPVVSLNGVTTYTDHNEELIIETPETALIISASEILGMIPEEEL